MLAAEDGGESVLSDKISPWSLKIRRAPYHVPVCVRICLQAVLAASFFLSAFPNFPDNPGGERKIDSMKK